MTSAAPTCPSQKAVLLSPLRLARLKAKMRGIILDFLTEPL
jgi:hypothetical protein